MSIVDVDALLQEVADGAPCGPNLEYDPEFLELEQAVLGKPEVQYGDTITPAVPPEWKVVKRLAMDLLGRSRDLRIAVPLLRATLAMHGPQGLADSLRLIERLLGERWDSVHPQLDPDDDNDPMLRINSLAALIDGATFLRELKDMPLVNLPGLGALSVRHLEIANGEIPPTAEQEKLSMTSIEAAIADVDPERLQAAADAMRIAHDSGVAIEAALVRQVGSSQALNLGPMNKCLKRGRDFLASATAGAGAGADSAEQGAAGVDDAPAAAGGGAPAARPVGISGDINTREDVLRMFDKICTYYQRNEPSSPVPLLLERAKRLVPKNFFEIMEDLAPDGMAQLSVITGQKREESY